MADLNGISSIYLPRFVGIGSSQLLCFCDLSSKDLNDCNFVVVYCAQVDGSCTEEGTADGSADGTEEETHHPRLELMSVLFVTRSLHFVAKAMRLENVEKILCTDFQCILQWIKNRENTSVIVRNRITEIISETDVAL